ncbi:MAG: ATP-dependent DNA ligase [Candidatus Pristimantibacillus sp.]
MLMDVMLMERHEQPFRDKQFIFEPMIDGQRLLLSFMDSKARLFTKHHNEVTRQYPELLKVPLVSPADVVLDGEVAYVNPITGKVEFESLLERYRMKKQPRIRDGVAELPLRYFVFDVLYYNGIDMRERPLIERKRLLNELIVNNEHFRKMPYIEEEGDKMFEVIKQLNLEGMAGKRKDSVYSEGHHEDWLKIVNYRYAKVELVGWRKNRLGWLARMDGRDVGIIEHGITQTQRKLFDLNMVRSEEDRDFVYAKQGMMAAVKYRNWSKDGKLRGAELDQLFPVAAEIAETNIQ